VVVGSGGVGKSCLSIRFLKDDFTSDYDPTVEENYRKSVVVDSLPCQLSIIDTAGQHEYEALRDQHLASGNGFILVFALNSADSLEEIKQLRERIVMARNKKRLPMVAVGNKCDLPENEREVNADSAQAYFSQFKIPYFETSAKVNINVTEAFQELVRQCRKDVVKATSTAVEKTGAVAAAATPAAPQEKKGGCCIIL
ncbi:small GTPase superfamily, partial [Catenaria anguillulae PL171]